MLSCFKVMTLKPWWCAFVVSVRSIGGRWHSCATYPFCLPPLVLFYGFLLLARGCYCRVVLFCDVVLIIILCVCVCVSCLGIVLVVPLCRYFLSSEIGQKRAFQDLKVPRPLRNNNDVIFYGWVNLGFLRIPSIICLKCLGHASSSLREVYRILITSLGLLPKTSTFVFWTMTGNLIFSACTKPSLVNLEFGFLSPIPK